MKIIKIGFISLIKFFHKKVLLVHELETDLKERKRSTEIGGIVGATHLGYNEAINDILELLK